MDELFTVGDDLGPAKVIYVQEPRIGLKGVLVVDNVATGPSIGGLRMAPDVSVAECRRLARAMTLKNAAAGLPHGGGKSVIFGDPKMEKSKKEELIRTFAHALRNEDDYIFGPDMGTNEECMAWIKDEIGRSVGLPREVGGIPLDEIGATGWGISHATEVALEQCDFDIKGARLVVQGFGAVGKHSARYLVAKGAILVAVADSEGAIHDPSGLDLDKLLTLKREGKSVTRYKGAKVLERDAVVGVDCDIWIPAARPDVVSVDNVDQLKAKLVVQGANIPFTPEAENILAERGVLVIPDFIANAGGVICAAMEYVNANQAAALATIEEKLRANTREVLATANKRKITAREAAIALAGERVRRAMGFRRYSIF